MNKGIFKYILTKIGLLSTALRFKNIYIQTRTVFLRFKYPKGKLIRCNGGEIFVDFHDANYLWYYGNSEFLRLEHIAFKSLLAKRSPRIIIDIGAHWGIFPSQLNADNSPLCSAIERVICIEADPTNILNLTKTVDTITKFKVEVAPFAISDSESTISLYKGGGTCLQTYERPASKYVCDVKAAPLQVILARYSIMDEKVTHIKLDIDGYEPAFFYGASEFLKRHKPLLLIEFWANGLIAAGFNLEKYWEYLNRNYYITETVYPGATYLNLTEEDLPYLVDKTLKGITNLLLIPR